MRKRQCVGHQGNRSIYFTTECTKASASKLCEKGRCCSNSNYVGVGLALKKFVVK